MKNVMVTAAGLALLATALVPGAAASASTGVASVSEVAAVASCSNAALKASYVELDHATSQTLGRIVLTNVSGRPCRTGGFGGLSYVGHGDGTQIGAAADRVPGGLRSFVLKPGQRAGSRVVTVSTGPYSKRECRPTAVDGFRVYVPNATRSQFVAHPTRGCGRSAVHLITHHAFRPLR